MIAKLLFNIVISFFCAMGAFMNDSDFWQKSGLVALVICGVYVLSFVLTAESKFAALIVDVAIPCVCGCILSFVVFNLGIMGALFLSGASTIIVPLVATIFDL